jgi:cytochrome c553
LTETTICADCHEVIGSAIYNHNQKKLCYACHMAQLDVEIADLPPIEEQEAK